MPSSNLPSWISRGLRQSQLSQLAAPGSIAARADPMRYGSLAARRAPGAFDPSTVQNNDILQRQNKIDSGLSDKMYEFNNSMGLHRAQLDQNADDRIYQNQRLLAAGMRRPLRPLRQPGVADPSMFDTQFDYGEDDGN